MIPSHYAQEKAAIESAKKAEHETWREKQTSRMLLEKGNREALDDLADAREEINSAVEKAKAEYMAKIEAMDGCKIQIRQERQEWWDRMQKSNEKQGKERSGFEAIIKHLEEKQNRVVARLNTQLNDRDAEMKDTVDKMVDKHDMEMKDMQSQLDHQKDIVHEEKTARRRAVQGRW